MNEQPSLRSVDQRGWTRTESSVGPVAEKLRRKGRPALVALLASLAGCASPFENGLPDGLASEVAMSIAAPSLIEPHRAHLTVTVTNGSDLDLCTEGHGEGASGAYYADATSGRALEPVVTRLPVELPPRTAQQASSVLRVPAGGTATVEGWLPDIDLFRVLAETGDGRLIQEPYASGRPLVAKADWFFQPCDEAHPFDPTPPRSGIVVSATSPRFALPA